MIAAERLPQEFNVATWFVDRNIEEGRAGAPAFHYEGRTLTYSDVHDLTNRTGNALLELGVEMEDRVLVLALDAPEFLGAFWGAIKIGAVPVPVNTLLRTADYAYLLNDSRVRVAVVSAPLLGEAEAAFARRRRSGTCSSRADRPAGTCRTRTVWRKRRARSPLRRRHGTTPRSGCTHRARRGSRRAPCTSTTTW